jgi:fermentation-respiration switch protein FrsA (DUF1100 family)
MAIQHRFPFLWDDFATTDDATGYKVAITLPSGAIWRIDSMYIHSKTNYAAADTNYQTFTLYDSSGNAICAIANGSSTTGVAIGPTVVTGATSTMTAAYKYVDCRAAAKTVYLGTSATGIGRAMVGINGCVLATPQRSGLANVS